MKSKLSLFCVLTFAAVAVGQEKETTKIKTTTKTVAGGIDLLGRETFNVVDATPVTQGTLDLRLAYRYFSANAPANGGDSDDDSVFTPELVWGGGNNIEISASVPMWLGDAGNIPGRDNGNFDSYVGMLWRFMEPQGIWPAMALYNSLRIPTGDNSSGVDWEFRLAMTKDYANGMRSHLNFFGIVANNDNVVNNRDFQYGANAGMDGPLCMDGAVRWLIDYEYRISDQDGGGRSNMAEVGWQWQMNDKSKLGMSAQIGLDHAEDDSNNVGAALTYTYALMN